MKITKVLTLALLMGTALTAPAHATGLEPFLVGIGASWGLGVTLPGALTAGVIGAFNAGAAFGSFLAAQAGTLLLAAGSLLLSALNQRPMQTSQVNVRIPAGPRWHHAGRMKVGGNCVFAEFDSSGGLWYVIVHGDSELVTLIEHRLDDIVVTLDGSNRVTNDEFKAEKEGVFGQPDGDRRSYVRIFTRTWTPGTPTPPAVTELATAFPGVWTSDHKLVGTTFSVVVIDPVDKVSKPGVYKWQQGPLHFGEPGLTIVGAWARAYDPNEITHDIDDETTWAFTRNAALIWAWNRTRQFGFGHAMTSINWEKVAEAAFICAELVEDKDANVANRYDCGVGFSEDMDNAACEREILLACDGSVHFDELGRAYIKVGAWEEPTVTLSGARDILAMASRDVEDGEMETDGGIVTYIDADLGYIEQPCAPWRNPDFYDPARTPHYLQIKIEACQNHNQAVRLAKAFCRRAQAPYRLAPTVGLRALLLGRERIIDLDYDATYTGPQQIVSPVEINESGMVGQVALVPAFADNWDLNPGEEGDKPVGDDSSGTIGVPAATGVVLSAEVVQSSSIRLRADFDAPPSEAYSYQFAYSTDSGGPWLGMTADMLNRYAYSPQVSDGEMYWVRWRTLTTGGLASAWSTPDDVLAVVDPVAPGALTGVSVAGNQLGHVDIGFTAPSSANVKRVAVYRSPTGVALNRATHLVTEILVAPSQALTYIDGDDTVTDIIVNGGFPTDAAGWSLGTQWAWGASKLTRTTGGVGNVVSQVPPALTAGATLRFSWTMTDRTAGTLTLRLTGGTAPVAGTIQSTNAQHLETLVVASPSPNNLITFLPAVTFDGSLDTVRAYVQTPSCAPQGTWDYYLEAENVSGVPGPTSGPFVRIIV